MTLLRDVRPEEILRAGAVFGQVAEQVGRTVAQCRASADVRWNGPPALKYQEHLRSLVHDLGRIQTGYDAACDALLSYSRALVPVRDLALQADLLEAQAEDLKRARDVTLGMQELFAPMTPAEETVRARSAALRAAAEEGERVASQQVCSVLRAVADDAPRMGGWTSAGRFASDVAMSASAQLDGMAGLGLDAFVALPGLGNAQSRARARRELWQAAELVVQPWLAVEQALDELQDHRFGLIAGSAVVAVTTRGLGKVTEAMASDYEALLGSHAVMSEPVLRSLSRANDVTGPGEWVLEHEQRRFAQALALFRNVSIPPMADLLRDGVDLIHHEAYEGHTLIRHVGRDEAFLRLRQQVEAGGDGSLRARSSFESLDEAEALVTACLRGNAKEVLAAEAGEVRRLELRLRLSSSYGRVVDSQGRLSPLPAEVAVILRRDANGRLRIATAFLDEVGRS